MGLLNEYLDKNRLDTIPKKTKKNLEKLENKLKEKTAVDEDTFDDVLIQYSPQILDIVERASKAFKDMSLSFSKLKIVVKLGIEVYQLVDEMQDIIVTDEMSEEEKERAKINFGKDLIYFIYMSIDPLKDRFSWLPFKKSIEKKIVAWLAEMGLEAAVNLLKSVKGKIVEPMGTGQAVTIRVF